MEVTVCGLGGWEPGYLFLLGLEESLGGSPVGSGGRRDDGAGKRDDGGVEAVGKVEAMTRGTTNGEYATGAERWRWQG